VDCVVGDKLEKHSASVMTVLKPKTTHSEWNYSIEHYGRNLIIFSELIRVVCELGLT